jgi:hypothetical protein
MFPAVLVATADGAVVVKAVRRMGRASASLTAAAAAAADTVAEPALNPV